eukprot:jgi/Chlat1/4453/Chrsp29S00329
MAAGGAFGGSRGLQPQAPEKGVFPLDHFAECKKEMTEYMECLRTNQGASQKCRDLSKLYLQCRMDRNLMARQDLADLGFREQAKGVEEEDLQSGVARRRAQGGFVAGVRRKKPGGEDT